MQTYLLDSGLQLLKDQSNGVIETLRVTGFKIGDSVTVTPNSGLTDIVGNLVFTGTTDDIKYSSVNNDEIVLRYYIQHDDPEILIGNLITFVNDVAFTHSYLGTQLRKLNTTLTSAGTTYNHSYIINIPNLTSRFTFDNISIVAPGFGVFNDDTEELLPPYKELHDQIIITDHTFFNRLLPLFNINGQYWGNPFLVDYADVQFFSAQGGTIGDNHKYVKAE